MLIQVGIHYSRIYNINGHMAPFHCQEMMQPIAEQYKGKFALSVGSVRWIQATVWKGGGKGREGDLDIKCIHWPGGAGTKQQHF